MLQYTENEIKFIWERNPIFSNERSLTAMLILDTYHQLWQSLFLVMAIFSTWGMQNKVIDNCYAFILLEAADQWPRFSPLLP